MLASWHRFGFVEKAFNSCASMLRRSAPRVMRKALALLLIEAMAVTGSWSLVIESRLPGQARHQAPLGNTLIAMLAQKLVLPAEEGKTALPAPALMASSAAGAPALPGPFDSSLAGKGVRSAKPDLMFRGLMQGVPPGITGVQPNSGSSGTVVTITGANFGSTQGIGTVTFNGAPATVSSWSDSAIMATVPTGATTGNVQVNTAAGSSGGAKFNVLSTGLSVDQMVSFHGASFGTATISNFSTNSSSEVILAFVAAGKNQDSTTTSISGVSGGSLTWTLVERSNTSGGTSEVWRALASSALSNASITATVSTTNEIAMSMTLVSFIGADITGTNASGAIGALTHTTAPSAAVTTTRNNSMVFAVGVDPTHEATITPGTNQTLIDSAALQTVDCSTDCTTVTGNQVLWVQQADTLISSSGTTATMSDIASPADIVDFSVVEVLPAATAISTPLITSLSASIGVPGNTITVSGANFGSTQGTSTVTFNGVGATPTSWSASSIVVPVPGTATTGNVVVTVGGHASIGQRFIVTNASGLAVDQTVSSDDLDFTPSIAAPGLSTTTGNQTLLAFVAASGSGINAPSATVAGGGLTWSLVKRTNVRNGTAEIWRAFSPYILSNATIYADLDNNVDSSITVVSFLGVDTSSSGAGSIGATATANAASGAPTASLVTTRQNSMVFGVGDDSLKGTSRTPGSNQTIVHQLANTCFPNPCILGQTSTLWVQRANNSIASSGTNVTINDTAPTNGQYNLSLAEIRASTTQTPTITSLSPTAGSVGAVVTISGSNFGSTQGTSTVKFGTVPAAPTSWTATAIVVPVPSGVPSGPVSVVVNVAGTNSNPATFTVNAPLAITAAVTPAPNAAGWNSTNVTISYTCTGGVAPVQCASTQIVTTEGASQPFTGTATDAAGAHASVTTTLKIDKTPPLVSITSPANNSSANAGALTVSGSVSDGLSGIAAVTCNGVAATTVSGTFSCSVPLVTGSNTVTATAFDVAGNTASQSITVSVGPKIADFTPKTGPVGTAVSISGTGLSSSPNPSTVTFTGPNNTQLPARINFASSTQLAVVVPTGAVTGAITVTTSAGPVSTATPFTIGPRQDFAVTVAPGTGSLQQGSNVAFAVSVSSEQTNFTQLASLSATGLPQGALAVFNPAQITAGASSNLGIDLSATNLAVGTYPFVVHAVANVDGASVEKTASGTLNVVAAGQTTLSGQVLSTANQPIVGASVSIDGLTVLTDPSGHFFLTGVQAGTNRSLSVDGHSATSPNATFPLIFEPVNIITGRANVVSTPFHLPPIDTSQEVTIDPNHDTVAGNAAVANLQMTIPLGAHLRTLDGTLVTRTSITPLSPDRTPAPLPSDVGTNLVFTSQPGGAITDIAIPVIYPNLAGLNPGTEVELYAFNHASVSWYVYGKGMVSADGRTINPEIDPTTNKPYGLKDFSWHFANTGPNGNPSDPNACPSSRGQHPVDYSTGNKIENVQQVSWGGARGGLTFGLVFTSDKAQNCDNCPFGRGWTHNWDIRITGSFAPGGAGRLVMPQEVTGRLYNSSGTDSSGAPRFTSTATVSGLGGSMHVSLGGASPTQYRDTDGTILNFNSSGRLVSKVDRNGNTTTLTYNNGNLTQVTDPVGRSLTFTYDGSNRVISMTDPLNRTWHYSYEGTPGVAGVPGLTTITDPVGSVTKYTYVTGGRIAAITDPRGNIVKQITYDVNGRVATQTLADGGTETYTYSLSGTVVSQTTITSSVGRKETRRFDPNGYTLSVTDNQGQTSTITRDLNTGLPISSTGPCGCGTGSRTFNSAGSVTSATDAGGGQVQLNREPVFNNPVQITDPLGHVTNLVYAPNGNLLSVTNALNQTTAYTYDGFGELTSISDALGNSRRIEYDTNGNASAVVDALGNRATFTHDILGRTITSVDPLGHTTSFTYDPRGRPATYADAAGSISTYGYDANGNLVSTKNAIGQVVSNQYDAKNRLVSVTDAIGRITKLDFSTDNELKAITAPSGRIIRFATDAGGLLSGISDPTSASVSFGHDNSGRMTSLTDERGNTATIAYDIVGRPISRTDARGNTSTVTYDVAGNVTQATDRFGRSTRFVRDVLNRTSNINYPDASVSYTYDGIGRTTRIDDSESGFIAFNYDANGQVLSETTQSGTVQYAYDASGRVTTVTPANRPVITYGYDLAGRLASITQGTNTFTYTYDALSRRISLQRPNGVKTTYAYDSAGRLSRLTHTNAAGQSLEDFGYTFDLDDRIISISSLASGSLLPLAATGNAADANNRITQWGNLNLTFDDLGQTLSRTTAAGPTQYTWDARGRMTQATLPNGQIVSYSYDPLGRLAARTVNGVNTQFLYTGADIVLDTGSDGTIVDYVNGPGIDNKLSQTTAQTGPLYFLNDHLGSTVGLTGSNGALVEREQYEPYGFSPGSSFTRYGYTGRELDSATGLMFYRARWYDPQQARFLVEDPAGFAGGSTNLYTYTDGDPVNGNDPSGEFLHILAAALIGAAVGALATTASTLIFDGRLPTGAELAKGAVGGAVTGALVAVAGPLALPLASAMGGGVLGGMGAGAVIGGTVGAISGVAGQAAANIIDPCHQGGLGKAALLGVLGGAIGGGLTGAASAIISKLTSGAVTAAEDGTNALTAAEESASPTVPCGGCFPAGTKIHTKRGLVPIEKIKVGDEVLSRNLKSGELEYKRVIHLTKPHLDKLLALRVEGEDVLQPTPSHPFYVKQAGKAEGQWVKAADLKVGDTILKKDGKWYAITEIADQHKQVIVYNFEVEENHDYFVGDSGLLVHNVSCSFGTQVHQDFEDALTEQTGTQPGDWVMKTAPGETGVDATYVGPVDRNPGFNYAELKPVGYPNTAVGNQISNWGLPEGQTSIWWYNNSGIIGQTLGFW